MCHISKSASAFLCRHSLYTQLGVLVFKFKIWLLWYPLSIVDFFFLCKTLSVSVHGPVSCSCAQLWESYLQIVVQHFLFVVPFVGKYNILTMLDLDRVPSYVLIPPHKPLVLVWLSLLINTPKLVME